MSRTTTEPNTSQRRPFRWRVWLLAAGGVVVFAALAVRVFLATPIAGRMAADALSKQIGAPVEIGSVGPGLSSTTLYNVRIGSPGGGAEWAVIPELDLNTSLLGLTSGASPTELTLRNANVTLNFDADGKLLTRLPSGGEATGGGTPSVRLDGGRLAIIQTGHPDSVFAGINVGLREENGRLVLQGTLDDKEWGRWTLAGDIDRKSGAGNASLRTENLTRVTPDLLRRVPFVPQNVWDEISLDGSTTADVRLDFPEAGSFRYVVTCEPRDTKVDVSSIDLVATHASGTVKIEDAIVTLTDVTGRAAGGELRVPTGVLNFRDEPNVLTLDVAASNMVVNNLPPDWKIQQKVPVKGIGDGIFGGNAHLVLKLAPGGVQTDGSGMGRVVVPNFVSGQPLTVEMALQPRGSKFEFQQMGGGDQQMAAPKALEPLLALMLTALADPPAKKDEPKAKAKEKGKPKAAPTQYLDLNFSLRDVDLAELIQRLDVETPFKIGGRITFKVQAGIPTDAASDLKAYRFTGTAELPTLTIEELTLRDVVAKVVYRDGQLTLSDFSARVPDPADSKGGGSFKGTAALGLIPAGDLTASLDLDQLPVQQVLGLVPQLKQGAEGNFTGKLAFTAPAGNLRTVEKWTGNATLTATRAKAVGWVMKNVDLKATLSKGDLTLDKLAGVVEGAEVSADGKLTLADKYPYRGRVNLRKVDLAALDKLNPMLKPPVKLAGDLDADATLEGTLSPASITATGRGVATALRIEGFPIDKLAFRWDVDPDRVRVSDFSSELFGGTVAGTADIPLRNDAAGVIDLKVTGVDLTNLSKHLPPVLPLEGKADGTLKATIPPAKGDQPRQATAELDIKAAKLKVRNIPAERLRATADYRNGVLKYKVDAAALGGTIELDGRYPPAPEAAPKDPQGRLSIRNVQLARLWPMLGVRESSLDRLGGDIFLDLPFDYDKDGNPDGVGTARVEHLRFGDRELSPVLRSAVRLRDSELRLEQIESAFGVGSVRGLLIFNLADRDRSRAIVTLRNVPADRLLFWMPDLGRNFDVNVDAQIRTSIGREIRGGGVVSAASGKLFGQSVGSLRLPVDWDLIPSQNRGSVHVRDMNATLAQGRLTGNTSYEFFGDFGNIVDGSLRFSNVNLPSLIRTETNLGSLGVGQATGRFDFSGRDMQSFDQLTGRLTATLGRAQLTEIPVLREIIPFLGPSGRVADKQSEVRATLNKGVWRVEKLALVGQTLQLFAEGTITAGGRLNLNVNANTGRLNVSPLALRLAGIQIPVMVGPIPVGVLVSLSQYISNRTINLQVTGTINNPVVRLRPLGLLAEEAVRFFLSQYNVPLP